ncbi:antitoxin Xre/MbcA/ParS toxin-binding domain-containing protein [Cognatilysobacter terrigena]|uniref:antitoxin Xre/MbcA/ParS toxin-binding domain-containing protein n=1 Tax=Cognatilysobacter terrigena TaxID=2488749 RepID=UPI00105C2B32|nr:antitoxin Xre/MbcA/ParS toxin-binding domain-containing protein [Lysobacter terrigena]
MAEDDGQDPPEAGKRLRRNGDGRLSNSQAPGSDAALRRAARSTVCLRGLRAGALASAPPGDAEVLAKAARRTALWLKVDAVVFETATGLELHGDTEPAIETDVWDRCLALVTLGGRLERALGRRGVVVAWLHGAHLQLQPTPMAVLGTVGGLQVVHAYLDAFER